MLLDNINLPNGMTVKMTWPILGQTSFYSGDGTFVLQQCQKLGGQPIVLETQQVTGAFSGTGWYGAATYALVKTLLATVQAGVTHTLELEYDTFTVAWDAGSGNPIDYEPIMYGAPLTDDDFVSLTLRFVTIPS